MQDSKYKLIVPDVSLKRRYSNITVFTSSFPYGLGEQFFQNELEWIERYFDTVTIQPYYYGGARRRRPVDPGMIVKRPLLAKVSLRDAFVNFRWLLRCFPLLLHDLWEHKSLLSVHNLKQWNRQMLELLIAVINNDFQNHDLLYFYWGMGSVSLAPLFKRYTNAVVVCKFHGSDLYEELHGGWIPLRSQVLSASDLLVAISAHGKKYLDAYGFESATCCRLGVRNPYGFHNYTLGSVFTVVSCSSITPLKRVDCIAKAIMALDFPVEWHHFGGGEGFDCLQALVSSKKSDNAKLVLHGAVEHDSLMQFYARHNIDVFVNFSISEGIPVSMMEAISFAIPVIATDVGGNAEITIPSGGILLPSDATLEDLIKALCEVEAEPFDVRHERRCRARCCWEREFDADKNYPALMESILSLHNDSV